MNFRKEMDKLVREKMDFVASHREELITAWVAKTGYTPDESMMLVEEKNGTTNVWIESRTDRCLSHRNEIGRLIAELALARTVIDAALSLSNEWKIARGRLDFLKYVEDLGSIDPSFRPAKAVGLDEALATFLAKYPAVKDKP